jgi:hypothetical protein
MNKDTSLLILYRARASIHAITSCQQVLPWLQNIFYDWFMAIFHHINPKNLQNPQLAPTISS